MLPLPERDDSMSRLVHRESVAATSSVGTFSSGAPDWNWEYNPRGELVSSEHVNTGASSRHYTFDGIGNRTEHRDGTHTDSGGTATAYTPNALNQYDEVGSLDPAYDSDGNMTSGPLPAAPGDNSTLVWDGNNQLIEVTPYGGSTIKYHYDPLGRRLARTSGSNRTYWFYDGWNPIAEVSGAVHTTGTAPAVTLQKTWLWGTDLSGSLQGAGGVGGLLAATLETGGNAGVYQPLFDGNGNIGQYINSSGIAVAKYEYDGFGNSLVSGGTHAADFPHRFSTKPLDPESGLYYYGYRYLDPATGRWPSRDPIEENGGMNLYGFVENSGVNRWDRLGLCVVDSCNNEEECKKFRSIEKIKSCVSMTVDEETVDTHFPLVWKPYTYKYRQIKNGETVPTSDKYNYVVRVHWSNAGECPCVAKCMTREEIALQVKDNFTGNWRQRDMTMGRKYAYIGNPGQRTQQWYLPSEEAGTLIIDLLVSFKIVQTQTINFK
jgi:RHS repeat-associated protein